MIFGFRIIVGLIITGLGLLSIVAGYKKWRFVLKMVFGKERLNDKGTGRLGFYMYLLGGVLLLLAALILT